MNREEWLLMRRKSIGASEAPILLLGELYGKTEVDLLGEKLGLFAAPNLDSIPHVRAGQIYEPVAVDAIRAWAAENYPGWRVIYTPEHPDHNMIRVGHVHATLDVLLCHPDTDEVVVIEIKCPTAYTAAHTEVSGPRDSWVIQASIQMGLAARKGFQVSGGWVAVWHTDEARLHWHMILWDSEAQKQTDTWIEYCEQWYTYHVLERQSLSPDYQRPPVAIARLQPGEVGDLTGTEHEERIRRYVELSSESKRIDAEQKEIRAALEESAQALGAGRLHAGKAHVARIVMPGRKSLDEKLLRLEHPDLEWSRYERQGGDYTVWRTSISD